MPLIIANQLSLIEEEAISLDLDSILNSNPITTVGSRRYDIIYTSVYYNAPHLYAFEYNGNEKALARLRKLLAFHPDLDETIALFITKYNQPAEENDVQEYAMQIASDYWNSYSEGQKEIGQDTIHFQFIHGKIPDKNYGVLDGNDDEDFVPPHTLIDQLRQLVQPWI